MMEALTSLALGHEATARVLRQYQVDPAQVFRAAGLDPEPYRDPDARLRIAATRKLWEQAERLTNNSCIAFEIGMQIMPANLHAVGYAWLASRTLREALTRLVRYHRLLSTAVTPYLEENATELTLAIVRAPGWPPQAFDALMTGVVTLCRDIADEDFKPASVQMQRPIPPCAEKLGEFFGCPIGYDAAYNCIVFPRAEVEKLLPRHNPALARASDEIALKYIANMDRSDVLSKAKLALMDMLGDGDPTRAALADRLNTSERTLARRLSARGVSFRALLDNVRKELGLGYMQEMRFAVTDVAYLLGFSDQSNFARSFRRWTGVAPSKYRAAHRARQAAANEPAMTEDEAANDAA
jgi:AraC-like DNA-binding protein